MFNVGDEVTLKWTGHKGVRPDLTNTKATILKINTKRMIVKTTNNETLKGVFGSLVQKDLLRYTDTNENGEIYRWTHPVCENDIKDVNELLTKKERA